MISNIDYMKLAMSYENDKTEIDPFCVVAYGA